MWGAREIRDKRGGERERERGSYLSLRCRKGTAGELARRRKKLYFLLWFALISFLSVTISFFLLHQLSISFFPFLSLLQHSSSSGIVCRVFLMNFFKKITRERERERERARQSH